MSTALVPSDRQERLPEILVVTDDLFLRKLLRRQLEQLGCAVREAVSVRRALARIQDATPDLVLLDPTLDQGEGVTIVQSLRSRRQTEGVPVLLLTTDRRSEPAGQAVALGALGALAAIPVRRTAAIAPWIEAALPALREPW